MWCPKCRNEYVKGITECPDCHMALVEESAENAEETLNEKDAPCETAGSAHAYISKRARAEDLKSTAYTFTLVGGIGIVLLILFLAGVLPIQVADYMKVLMGVVMGAMLLIFFFIGIRSFRQLKSMYQAAEEEEKLFEEVTGWFHASYFPTDIDGDLSGEDVAQCYFKRYTVMRRLIADKYPDLEEDFCDHIIETLYSELFPDSEEA